MDNAEAARAERAERAAARRAAVASGNAAALLCDLVLTGCAPEGCTARSLTLNITHSTINLTVQINQFIYIT